MRSHRRQCGPANGDCDADYWSDASDLCGVSTLNNTMTNDTPWPSEPPLQPEPLQPLVQHCYRHNNVEAGVTCQRCGRVICSACMTNASVGHHCPECVSQAAQRVIPARELFAGTSGDYSVTKVLIALNVLMYGLDQGVPGLFDRGNTWGPAIGINDEWWRLISGGFLHVSPMHLLMNMVGLYIFGRQLEPVFGRVRYLILYVGSLLAGSAGVMLLGPFEPTRGASGAIYGLVGAYAMLALAQKKNLWEEGIISLIGIYVLFSFFGNVSLGGHIGGLVGGFLFGGLFLLVDKDATIGRRVSSDGGVSSALIIGVGVALAIGLFVLGIVLAPTSF